MARNKRLSGPFLPVPRWILEYTGNDHVANTVLLFLLQYLHPDTQELTTSYQHIADQMGCNRRTVIRAVNRLVELGLIVKEERTRKTGQTITNRFYINFNSPASFPVMGVTPQTLGGVTPETLGGDSPVTGGGDSTDTQSRVSIKSKKTRKGFSENGEGYVDERLR